MAGEGFRRIVDALRVPMAITDPKGRLLFANAAYASLAGSEAHALVDSALEAVFAPGDRKRIQQNVARVGEGKAASALLDARFVSADESEHWVQVALQPAPDAKEKGPRVVVVVQDIEVHRETERAFNLAMARLLALAEASPTAVMIENAAGDIELLNEPFCRLLALDAAPQSLTGLAADEVLARSPYLDKKAIDKARRKPASAATLALRLPDGRTAALERQPIVAEGEAAGGVWSPREEARAPEASPKGPAEIALIEKIGEELSVALEGLSAISIRAQQMEFDPALVEHFQRIRDSTETAMGAIGDLVDFSTVSGRVVLHKSSFALRTAVADLVARLTESAEEHDCRLRIKVEQDVSDFLEGDVDRLQLILRNLLENAFNALPGAEILLQITPEYITESGIQLSFGVVVTGEGDERAGAAVAVDSGMGIAVAKFMVAAMGGKLAIAMRPTPGDALYAFTVEFPVRPSPPAPTRPTYVSLVGLPALVVSGDSEQRLALVNLLRGWRMVPMEADNAPMAIALLERMHGEKSPVPLVILSNRLAGQDGFLLAFRIKHHAVLHSTLMIMLATEGKPGDAIACRENGISAYMRYPINDRQLNEAIVAVTGASVDADETPTLVTRHSLREHRKGATVLLVDANRDSQILAAHILGREECSVVVAHDLEEALAALDQDVYDLVLVETSLPGLTGEDAAQLLRKRITRDPESANLVAVSVGHSPAYRKAKVAAGFSATLAKPFRKDDLLALLQSVDRTAAETA